MPLDVLSGFLSPFAQQRVVGVLDWDDREHECDGVRGDLMQKWLEKCGLESASWLAIDDQGRHYVRHKDHLVETSWSGMDETSIDRALVMANARAGRTGMTRLARGQQAARVVAARRAALEACDE
ncbi:hypothetical protein LP417_33030 (plasmid) [Polaromonas sp. P1-6]|nr:hypothetical protein LP417_33030 [Polaromonas sp. P1-6]